MTRPWLRVGVDSRDRATERLARALVVARPLARPAGVVRLPLGPGDVVHVQPGEAVALGARLVERLRDPQLVEVPWPDGSTGHRSGDRLPVPGPGERSGRRGRMGRAGRSDGAEPRGPSSGELLMVRKGRALVVHGEHLDEGVSPVAGTVLAVRPGVAVEVSADGWQIPGSAVLGEPSYGPLAIVADDPTAGRPLGLDVGLAGAVAVVPGRVDAETISRARAMGLRGLVVGSLPGRVWRAVAASEQRQRAALHRRPPFGVLVLDGTLRRPIPSPVRALLAALEGRSVGIVPEPPCLVVPGPLPSPAVPPDRVVVRAGPWAGLEGRLLGLVGVWRFPLGMQLVAGRVATDSGEELTVPIGDLERFVLPEGAA